MKIVAIKGGLGNQLYQLQFCIWLKKRGHLVYYDDSYFNEISLHEGLVVFELLSAHGIQKADTSDIDNLKDCYPLFRLRYWIGILLHKKGLFVRRSHFIQSNHSEFTSKFGLESQYLDGYWQNLNYRTEQMFLGDYSVHDLKQHEFVAVHMRFIDRWDSKRLFYSLRLLLFWRVESREYYLEAIAKMPSSYPIYVATNNQKKAMKIFENLNRPVMYLDGNFREDFVKISAAKYFVGSISTYSHWAALNGSRDKIVVMPKKGPYRLEQSNYSFPESWILIE